MMRSHIPLRALLPRRSARRKTALMMENQLEVLLTRELLLSFTKKMISIPVICHPDQEKGGTG